MPDDTTQPILDTGAPKILAVQSVLIVAIAWAFYLHQAHLAAQSALYGGCIALFNVWLMNFWLKRAAAQTQAGKEIQIFYLAALQRFVLTLVLFIIGMGLLALEPIPMLITFALAQLGYFFKGKLTPSKSYPHNV